MRVLRSLLSLCSVTHIWCLMISAEVMGRLLTVGDDLGLPVAVPGDEGLEPHELLRLDVERRSILRPRALFTRLVTAIPTPGALGDPSSSKLLL